MRRGFRPGSFQNAHRFHHHRAAGRVVGGAGAAGPGIEMRAEHDDFVFLVAARQLGDHVEGVLVVVVKLVLDIEFQRHGNLLIDQPGDAIVVLRRERDGGNRQRILLVLRARAGREHGAAVAARPFGDSHQRAFVRQELIQLVPESQRAAARGAGWRPGSRAERAVVGGVRRRAQREDLRGQIGVGECLRQWRGQRLELPRGVEQHDLALQLAFELLHVVCGSNDREHRLSRDLPFVPGDHGRLKPISGAYCGSLSCALNFTCDQPRPNGPHSSSAACSSPQELNWRTAHSAAAFSPGDPVSRGP